MKRILGLGIMLVLSVLFQPTHAEVISTGDVVTTLSATLSPALTVGDTSSGAFTVNSGSSATYDSVLAGNSSGSTGTVTVSGSSSSLTINDTATVGLSGTGSWTINDGGSATVSWLLTGVNSGSAGTVTVDNHSSLTVLMGAMAGGVYTGSPLYNLSTNGISSFSVKNGSSLFSSTLDLHNGSVLVTGSGSTLAADNLLMSSNYGSTLTINQGATVTTSTLYMSRYVGDNSTIQITDQGSLTVHNPTDYIVKVGVMHDTTASIVLSGVGSSLTVDNDIQFGLSGLGTLSLSGGATLTADKVRFGCADTINSEDTGKYGTGKAVIDGVGTSLHTGELFVGVQGEGTVNILNGGQVVSSGETIIGYNSGGKGKITVDGAGSQLQSSSLVIDAMGGNAQLFVARGGSTTVTGDASIGTNGIFSMRVGDGSSFSVGGTLTNSGTIRLSASARATSGSYNPTQLGSLTGSGKVQALGGIWNGSTGVFTVSETVAGNSGQLLKLDLLTQQRALITDAATSRSVGMSFMSSATTQELDVTATTLTGSEVSTLLAVAGTGQQFLAGWNFTITSGYTEGDPVLLSLSIGSGHSLDELSIWHYDGVAWAKYSPDDLTLATEGDNSQEAEFTVLGFSSYAITSAVPEPATWALLLASVSVLGFYVRRRKVSDS